MESFIRYLYEYKNEQRIRNVGFVKVDRDENGETIQIHGRGTFLNNADIHVYLIYMEGRACYGIPMGELTGVQSIISCRLVYDRAEIERYAAWEKLKGVILDTKGQGVYAAVWDETVIPIDRMKQAVPLSERPSDEENPDEAVEDGAWEEPEETKEMTDAQKQEEAVTAEDIEVMEASGTAGDGSPSSVEACSYRKIDRADMTELPRKNWYYANNSFLLHGYYNYHHLLLAEEGETYLGVPGVYHRREAVAAQSFGFPEFRQIPEGILELSAQECERSPSFGYWCRKIEKE